MRRAARDTISNKRRKQRESETDRISQLPIDILLHIFYLLPFESWLTMSNVSKRFKHLWTYIPFLDFDQDKIEDKIMKNNICPKYGEYHHIFIPHPKCLEFSRLKFARVVDRTLRLHSGSTLNSFSLTINYDEHNWDVLMLDKWVSFAMTRNIKAVALSFYSNTRDKFIQYAIPCKPFASKVLTILTLNACQFKATSFGTFENLSSLNVTNVTLLDHTIGHLLSKFPKLSELCMESCVFEDKFFVTNQVLKVKYLYLGECVTSDDTMFTIHITAPNLVDFHLSGTCMKKCSIERANKLTDAYINIINTSANGLQGDFLCSLLKDLNHCQCLNLSSWCIQVLATRQHGGPEPFYQLRNTKELNLCLFLIKQEFPGICCLLRSCPKLQTLYMSFLEATVPESVTWEGFDPDVFGFDEDTYWESQVMSFACLKNSLKTITIEGFTGRAMELQILKFLIEKGMLLETLDMGMTYALHEADIVKNFKRASPHLRVIINDELAN